MSYFYREAKRAEASQPSEVTSEGVEAAGSTTGEPSAAGGELPEDSAHDDIDDDAIPKVYRVHRDAWPFEDMDHLIRKLLPQKYWGPNVTVGASNARLDLSTATFPTAKSGVDWKSAYEGHERVSSITGCNALVVPFHPAQDATCVKYLSTIANWKSLKPLAMGFDQRTIKFEVDFVDIPGVPQGLGIGSILKVPQRLFPNEAFSEVASYEADRVMHIRRIPPTGWVCIPITMLRSTVERYGSTVETVDEFLQESNVHNYTEWVEKDMFEYVKRGRGYELDAAGNECIGASIQMKVADVAHLLDSALKIPYVPHNESWFRFLDIAHHHDDKQHPLFFKERYAPSILHISELNTFDYVIGNGDRSPNKNNFVVGGCVRPRDCGNRKHDPLYLWHPNHPTYVHLDQGMGFYGNPRRNPIVDSVNAHKKDPDQEDTFCLFRTPLINRLLYLHTIVEGEGRDAVSRFERLMLLRLPQGVRHFVSSHTLKQCHDRLTKLLHLVERCNNLKNPRVRRYVMAP